MKRWLRKLMFWKPTYGYFIYDVGSKSEFLSVLTEPLSVNENDYAPPIVMAVGDTLEVSWSIEITYDPERRLISIRSGNTYIGTIAAEDGWKSVHKMRGSYSKTPKRICRNTV